VTAADDAVAPLRAQGPGRLARTIVTPEGVAISVTLASRGDRAVAFLLDFLFIGIALVVLFLLVVLVLYFLRPAPLEGLGDVALSLSLLAFFLLRNFYFTYFEIRRAGQTPGKRIVGIKVIDRRGGPLGADAVFARNLTRELEVFLPLTFLLGGGGLLDSDIARIAAIVWAGVFALMPLFNRDILRIGDMVGGTWVVTAPKAMLLGDLTGAADQFIGGQRISGRARQRLRFTDAQLDVYGIYELQTLEDVLRRQGGADTEAILAEVASRIMAKIGWQDAGRGTRPRAFLEDFYAALRQRLETRMLFGERRERKRAG